MVKKKIVIGVAIVLLVLIVGAGIYLLFPKYEFKLEDINGSTEVYKVSVYGNRMVLVTYGYQKQIAYDENGTVESRVKKIKERDFDFSLRFATVADMYFLSEKDYAELQKIYENVSSEKPKYLEEAFWFSDIYPEEAWQCCFNVNGESIIFRFAKDKIVYEEEKTEDRIKTEEKLLEFVQSALKDSDADIRIPGMRDTVLGERPTEWLKESSFTDRIVERIWLSDDRTVNRDDWLHYILWELFPPKEEPVY